MVACTKNSPASLKYNAVDILKSISPMIRGGGGGRPTLLKAEEVTLRVSNKLLKRLRN